MADHIYLDGSQPYHRHAGSPNLFSEGQCLIADGAEAVTVHVFDTDALAAHDAAIRQEALAGEGTPPLYVEGEWAWAIGEPNPVGEDAGTLVLAGERPDGTVHLYATPERIARVCFDAITRELG